MYSVFNKMFYSVFTQLQYISSLATCCGFAKKKAETCSQGTIFRPALTIGTCLPIVNVILKMVLGKKPKHVAK